MGRRFTWLLVGSLVALLAIAGVDALRSSADLDLSASTEPATTRSVLPTGSTPPCAQGDLRLTIEISNGVASVVWRNITAHACLEAGGAWRSKILDRRGDLVARWRPDKLVPNLTEGSFWPPGTGKAAPFAPFFQTTRRMCKSPDPFVLVARIESQYGGAFSTRLDNVSRDEIIPCASGRTSP